VAPLVVGFGGGNDNEAFNEFEYSREERDVPILFMSPRENGLVVESALSVDEL
jgi:hypothetical protein